MKNNMKNLLTLEELAQFILSILLFNQLDYAWWVFPALLLLPDVSMIGYLFGPKIGGWIYNFAHHKFLAIALYAAGTWSDSSALCLAGILLFGHSALDRIFGYGLKYLDDFKHTHLGWIGKEK